MVYPVKFDSMNGDYGVAVAQKPVELLVRVQLPIVTHEKRSPFLRAFFVGD